jgi:hypothetical protein
MTHGAAGRARQDVLYASWGGRPTTAMLEYRDTRLNPRTKKILRECLSCLGASFPIFDQGEEQRDPKGADVKIGTAIDEIWRRAKAKGMKVVHREHINDGAAQNAYDLTPPGLATCLIPMAVLTITIATRGRCLPTAFE